MGSKDDPLGNKAMAEMYREMLTEGEITRQQFTQLIIQLNNKTQCIMVDDRNGEQSTFRVGGNVGEQNSAQGEQTNYNVSGEFNIRLDGKGSQIYYGQGQGACKDIPGSESDRKHKNRPRHPDYENYGRDEDQYAGDQEIPDLSGTADDLSSLEPQESIGNIPSPDVPDTRSERELSPAL